MLRFPTAGDVTALAFSPDGRRLAVGDPWVRLYDPFSGRPERELESSTLGAGDLAFSPDGGRLAAGDGRTVDVWRLPGRRPADPPLGSVVPPAFAPDGRLVTAGGLSNPWEWQPDWCRLWFWDAATGGRLPHRLHFARGPLIRPVGVWWPADGPLVVAEAERVRRFDPDSGAELGETPLPAGLAASGGAGTAGGLVLAVERVAGRWLGSRRTGLAVVDADGSRHAADFSGRPGSGVWAASPDGRRAVRAEGPVVAAFDLLAGGPAGGLDPGVGPVLAVAYSADGLRLAAGGKRGVAVWDG